MTFPEHVEKILTWQDDQAYHRRAAIQAYFLYLAIRLTWSKITRRVWNTL